MTQLTYIDVSTWQGAVDWTKVKADGVDGVLIRAGFGSNTLDNKFIRNVSECNRIGLPCGVYWFSYALNAEMARKEAEYCLKVVEPYRVELPICFDFEYDSVNYAKKQGVTVTKALATEIVHAFCDVIEAAGYYVMNYANPDYLRNYFDQSVLKYDLWFAMYPASPDLTKKPRDDAGIWQYSSKGKVNGISGNVDMNVSYLDYRKIIADLCLNHIRPVKPLEKEDEDMDVSRFTELWKEMRATLQDNDAAQWSAEARQWAIDTGLVQGGCTAEFNGMWEDVLTREQMVTLLFRFAKLMGQA